MLVLSYISPAERNSVFTYPPIETQCLCSYFSYRMIDMLEITFLSGHLLLPYVPRVKVKKSYKLREIKISPFSTIKAGFYISL